MSWIPSQARIRVFCPCGPPHRARTREGLRWLEERGYVVECSPLLQRWLAGTASAPLSYLAGSDRERLQDCLWALAEGSAEAAWAVRGGYGLTRILAPLSRHSLDLERTVVGFSDVTALLELLGELGFARCVHGPNLQSLSLQDNARLARFLAEGRLDDYPLSPWIGGGGARGLLRGGNLCVLASLCGTPHQPKFGGCLLVLEDINEAPYRLDRYLTQLEESGAVDGVKGVLLGDFAQCLPESEVESTLRERLVSWNVPVWRGLPLGHGQRNDPLPLRLSVEAGGGRLHLGEIEFEVDLAGRGRDSGKVVDG